MTRKREGELEGQRPALTYLAEDLGARAVGQVDLGDQAPAPLPLCERVWCGAFVGLGKGLNTSSHAASRRPVATTSRSGRPDTAGGGGPAAQLGGLARAMEGQSARL